MDVKPIRNYCYEILPLVFDNSLSYYECLCKVVAKINEVIANMENFVEEANKYTDSQIAALDEKITKQLNYTIVKLEAEMKALQDSVNAIQKDLLQRMQELETKINLELAENKAWVTTQINALIDSVNKQITALHEMIVTCEAEVKAYVDQEIQKVIDMIPEISNPKVVNPITGKLEPLQEVLNFLVDVFKQCAWTAMEFDNEGLTTQEFDDFKLTALEFDINGKCKQFKDPRFYMHNPATGTLQFYQEVIKWLISLHQDSITAEKFDSLELTVNEFQAKNLTAYEFDFNGNTLLPA